MTIVHDKAVVLSSEYEDISVPSDKVTMPLLFVDNKVWYGLPILNYVCYEGNVAYPILADIIVRFSGEKTVKMIKSLTEHTNDSTPITGGFGLYVRKNLSCPQCGEPLAMARKNGVFLWCKKCRKSQKLSAQMVNKYLDTTGGECPRCNKSLCAVNGMYGVYIKCSNNHTFKPEEV